ncbi:MAG: TonB-dependent receptor, partial [Candidatus Cloacimonetes bacterium]|nr:TonB-dependent receptor [Candidatus Cloacimonadota bacterium]
YCNYLDYYVLGKHYQNSGGGKLKFKYQEQDFYFDWGGNYRHETFEYRELTNEDDSIPKVFQDNYALFANTKLSQDIFPYSLSLFLSGRWDFTSEFKDFGSWKISPECSYENVFKFIVGGSAGNGFTIPSFYNLYWKGDSQAMGNPYLIPEESLSWQVFSKVELYDNFIKFSYRHDDIDNMIIWFQNFNYTWKPTNLSAAEVSNYEIEAEINLFQFLKLAGTYIKIGAFDRTRNEDGSQTSFYGKKIIYTPDFAMNLNFNLTYKNLNCRISYAKTSEQWSTRDQLTEEKQLPAYDLVDGNVFYSKQLRKFEIKTGIRANNIFDKLYEIYEYIPQPGFNWEVSIKIEYKI